MDKRHNSINNSLHCAVYVYNYAAFIKLGVTEAERATRQKILVDIKLSYPEVPEGCYSDEVADVICYDKLCNKVLNLIQDKEFKLIEHLAFDIYNHLKSCYLNYPLNVKIMKFPKISNLEGCAAFEIKE